MSNPTNPDLCLQKPNLEDRKSEKDFEAENLTESRLLSPNTINQKFIGSEIVTHPSFPYNIATDPQNFRIQDTSYLSVSHIRGPRIKKESSQSIQPKFDDQPDVDIEDEFSEDNYIYNLGLEDNITKSYHIEEKVPKDENEIEYKNFSSNNIDLPLIPSPPKEDLPNFYNNSNCSGFNTSNSNNWPDYNYPDPNPRITKIFESSKLYRSRNSYFPYNPQQDDSFKVPTNQRKYKNKNQQFRTPSNNKFPIEHPKNSNLFNRLKSCYFCNDIVEEEILTVCDHRICGACLFTSFEKYLGSENKGKTKFGCQKCGQVFLGKDFKEMTLKESYIEYLNFSSVLVEKNPFNHISKHFEYFKICNFCGEEHFRIHKSCINCFKGLDFKCCSQCKNIGITEPINCDCILCLNCIRSELKKQLKVNPKIKIFQCYCGTIIHEVYVRSIFQGLDSLKLKRDKYSNAPPKRECRICLGEFSSKKLILLNCNHSFCNSCLKKYLSYCIEEGSMLEIYSCPECFGSSPDNYKNRQSLRYDITENMIKDILDYKEFKMYEQKMLRNIKFDTSDKKYVLKWCKNCKWGGFIESVKTYSILGFVLYSKPQKFSCEMCKSSYCAECNKIHKGKQCKDPRLSVNINEIKVLLGQEYYENFLSNFIQCPSCHELIEKIGGCNFIHCKWPTCQKTYFCGICKLQLLVRYK